MERPMLFKDEMVRAILEGRKTQTRRLIKPQPTLSDRSGFNWKGYAFGIGSDHRKTQRNFARPGCHHGQPGDRLWIRETWRQWVSADECGCSEYPCGCPYGGQVLYRADYRKGGEMKWRPSIHMPRWASRITLEITNVRVERLQDITEQDAIAEGAQHFPDLTKTHPYGQDNRWSMEQPERTTQCLGSARMAFANYFCKLSGKAAKGQVDPEPWDANPWVWVIEFKRVGQQAEEAEQAGGTQ